MTFKEKLKTKEFIVTAELFPPKGVNIDAFLKKADILAQVVDAINVTDNQRASMRVGSLAMCRLLRDRGIETIMQMTCRDRNRIALQSDLLSANVLGLNNILILSGDHPNVGEYAGTKTVYDLDTIQLIKTARLLETGVDFAGKKLNGSPKFCLGAVANPTAAPIDLQILMLEKKVESGIEFVQTQTVFDVIQYREFFEKTKNLKVRILPGVSVIKSVAFMDFLKKLPGVNIPQAIQERIISAEDPFQEGLNICAETIKELKAFTSGVHIMAIGIEEYIPEILKRSELI
ncbi:MAG: methylenetetrahydrofolate reductase [Endomicrobiaceae bacterium]|jgi:5,10-methylenetetrahydrofolate reductase|nr:methylenetetrahydrofolate reductase [Endomicrobiaceae bacterium]MDD3729533.1 methylenetetrahydrofolate reductase [Endomicrobiaceae bacterium]MDD4165445.1 methylenetetrahydrofolate reductase [Endomicrobiaceae bacterium]